MEITIKGNPKEIAALVLKIQGQQESEKWEVPKDNMRHVEGPVYDHNTGKKLKAWA